MTELPDIEKLTTDFRRRYDVLTERVQRTQDEQEAIRRRAMPGIRSALQAAAEARDRLAAAIETAPELFEKPRTHTVAGIRVGLMKGKGKVVVENHETTCRRIRQHFPDQADNMIKVTEKALLSALGNLTAAELKRIGARVEQTGDEIVIKPVDGDIDKLVSAMMAEAQDWEAAACTD